MSQLQVPILTEQSVFLPVFVFPTNCNNENDFIWFNSNTEHLNNMIFLVTNSMWLCVWCVVWFSFPSGVLRRSLFTHLRILSSVTLLTHSMTHLSLFVARVLTCAMKTWGLSYSSPSKRVGIQLKRFILYNFKEEKELILYF